MQCYICAQHIVNSMCLFLMWEPLPVSANRRCISDMAGVYRNLYMYGQFVLKFPYLIPNV